MNPLLKLHDSRPFNKNLQRGENNSTRVDQSVGQALNFRKNLHHMHDTEQRGANINLKASIAFLWIKHSYGEDGFNAVLIILRAAERFKQRSSLVDSCSFLIEETHLHNTKGLSSYGAEYCTCRHS